MDSVGNRKDGERSLICYEYSHLDPDLSYSLSSFTLSFFFIEADVPPAARNQKKGRG